MWRSSAWSLIAWVVLLPQADAGPNESKQGAITEPGFGRSLLPLDAGWRFQRGEPDDAKGTDLDDAEWEEITLPHTFNGADGDDGGTYHRCPAWYRRTLAVTRRLEGRRLFLQFDGAALVTDVYVNSQFVGRHEGGYATFRFDITPHIRPGENLLAVRVDNSKTHVAPLGGDFTVFGGLYRRVFVLETPALHVDALDYGGPGVHVSTDNVRPGVSADLEIAVLVRNELPQPAPALVTTEIVDARGQTVERMNARVVVGPHATQRVRLHGTLRQPRLWDGVRDPYLYRVSTEVRRDADNSESSDVVTVPLGIRTISIDPRRGFILNGNPVSVHGVNLFHSGRPGRGLAVTDAEVREDMATVQALGATGVRFVHFQHPQLAYEEADRLGLLVWTEIPLNGAIDSGDAFMTNLAQQMRELIRQHYNHPSVVVWGLGNEVYEVSAQANRVLDVVQRTAKQEDPTRPTVYAHCCQSDDNEKALHSDVSAFNRYFGWYPDQKGDLGAWARGFHEKFPARAFAVGEYGAGASIRHQEDPPKPPDPPGGWHPEQYQSLFHEDSWRGIRDLPYVWGKFVWVAFDVASDGRAEGDRPGINDKGLVTYDRAVRKDAFYWYQANWSREPMLHLTSSRMEVRTQPDAEVKAYSNLQSVTLRLNGTEIGTTKVIDHIARWPGVTLRQGVNEIEVQGTTGERVLRSRAVWHYEPHTAIASP